TLRGRRRGARARAVRVAQAGRSRRPQRARRRRDRPNQHQRAAGTVGHRARRERARAVGADGVARLPTNTDQPGRSETAAAPPPGPGVRPPDRHCERMAADRQTEYPCPVDRSRRQRLTAEPGESTMSTAREVVIATLTENGATAPEVDTDTLADRILGALHGA